MSSSLQRDLQTEKTKHDAKSLSDDVGQHISNAGERVSDAAHKTGVAMGVSEPTTGEKIGSAISKGVDSITGKK